MVVSATETTDASLTYLCQFIISSRTSQGEQAVTLFGGFMDTPAFIQQLPDSTNVTITTSLSKGTAEINVIHTVIQTGGPVIFHPKAEHSE
jgi:hypothetical protein